MKEVRICLLLIHTKVILMTTSFLAYSPQRTSPHSMARQQKNAQTTNQNFPFRMPTQCNEQMESHTTTYPKQFTLLEGLAPRLLFRKVLPSEIDRQHPIPPPTLSTTLFQETQFIQFFHTILTKTPLSKCLHSATDKQHLIPLPTQSSTLFQKTQHIHYFCGRLA